MRTETPHPIRLAEYTSPAFHIAHTALTFRLHPTATRVLANLNIEPARPGEDLVLDGKGLKLIRLEIDGSGPIPEDLRRQEEEALRISAAALPEGPFTLVTEVEINPEANTELEGLYMSKGMYCTQCEAEGFRKITFYPDRPDVMATFDVRIEADLPVLLSNGNARSAGAGWAEWHDPWPKPAYLFALVAGDLRAARDRFTTASGRDVQLNIWVRPGDEGKCLYALDALKRSMRWDEEAYGREYDLDVFNIVAVDDFNMGAMENKGLNIFNSKYVLASPETATDVDYEFIEGIIAHEYFHNWTGNRITCRDWFQLCLKEGLTVFRDQQFSGDQRSHAVKRIDDVKMLRARQFREDAGPLAHPVRPEEYIEINNFYTATVYEKGAEVIGMLRRLVGQEAYRAALDLYFQRHDGEACTIEDWLQVFEDATGRDLAQFKRWYSQAGTPHLAISQDQEGRSLSLLIRQATQPTPGQPEKAPLHMPFTLGALYADGSEAIASQTVELTDAETQLTFTHPRAERVILSLNRGFSAPVTLSREETLSEAERATLLAHDPDPFAKWETGHAYALETLASLALGEEAAPSAAFLAALARIPADETLDPAFRALMLTLPSVDEICKAMFDTGAPADPAAAEAARRRVDAALAEAIGPALRSAYSAHAVPGPYTPDAAASGHRALRGRLLALISAIEPRAETAAAQFGAADNMTEKMQALPLLVRAGKDEAAAALASFYDQWKGDPLVLDKWFSVQAVATPADQAAEHVAALTSHPDFDWKTPNRFRALIGGFAAGNPAGFHRADGAGYRLLTDWLIRLDPVNPQTTARLAGIFETWRHYSEPAQALILTELQRLADLPGLSKDTGEIVSRILDQRS